MVWSLVFVLIDVFANRTLVPRPKSGLLLVLKTMRFTLLCLATYAWILFPNDQALHVLGGEGTTGANKAAIKNLAVDGKLNAQGYSSYDLHKELGATISHLRFWEVPIKPTTCLFPLSVLQDDCVPVLRRAQL